MNLRRRVTNLVVLGGCVFGLVACGELFNASTKAADGSPSSDANATGNNAGTNANTNANPTPGNSNMDTGTTVGNTNTNAGNSNTNAGNANAGNANAGNGNTGTTPGTTQGLAAANGCTQATVTYGNGPSGIISSNCTSCHSGQSVKFGSYTQAVSGIRDHNGNSQMINQSMPPGGLKMADLCTMLNWADNNYAQ